MLKDKPKVSIITVTYNSAATIADTMESVRDQSYDNIEHIVVDGLSDDDTVKIVDNFPHVAKLISEKDANMYDALNKGIKMSSGDYIGVLNSDDFLTSSDSISRIVQALCGDGVEAVFSELKYVSNKDKSKVVRYCKSDSWTPEKFEWGYMPNHLTYYTSKENYDLHGYFSLDYNICADYELLIRHLYKARLRYQYIPECLVTMRPGGISNGSISKRIRLNMEIVKACRANGIKTNFFKLIPKMFYKISEYVNPKAEA